MVLVTSLMVGILGLGCFMYLMSEKINLFIPANKDEKIFADIMYWLRIMFQYFTFMFVWIIPTAMLFIIQAVMVDTTAYSFFNTLQSFFSNLFWVIFTPIYLSFNIYYFFVKGITEVTKK